MDNLIENPAPAPPIPNPPPVPTAPAPPDVLAPPPATPLVAHGVKSERVRRERERRIVELEDQNRQLQSIPAPGPAKRKLSPFSPIPIFYEDEGEHQEQN